MNAGKRYYVTGRVQGVFFRASTVTQAQSLGLRGSAKNLPDGRVEVIACGDQAALAALERWLWEGPPAARVTDVSAAALTEEEITGVGAGFGVAR